jgi:trans-2,3-dihydro-3-hydroxyanthranilate isomerase
MRTERLPFALLDVFTSTPLDGNGLAVVQEADGLDERTMLRFAKEMRLSETTFVQPATVEGADYRNRIWTIREEIPFAGHPSLGTAVAVALRRRDSQASYVQQSGAGLQPIEVEVTRDGARASMLQSPATFGHELDRDAVMAALGLTSDDGDPGLPPQIASTGLPLLIAPVVGERAVGRASLDYPAIAKLLPADVHVVYVVARTGHERAHARMLSPFVTYGEDPATGSAAGPLCAYLAQRVGWRRIEIAQGVEMGRPSRLFASMEAAGIRVAGDVVLVAEGTVMLSAAEPGASTSRNKA